jgi:hypothetical protein
MEDVVMQKKTRQKKAMERNVDRRMLDCQFYLANLALKLVQSKHMAENTGITMHLTKGDEQYEHYRK